jgi:hypothetical protein
MFLYFFDWVNPPTKGLVIFQAFPFFPSMGNCAFIYFLILTNEHVNHVYVLIVVLFEKTELDAGGTYQD